MNIKEKIALTLVITVLLAGAWFFRWEPIPISNHEGPARAYMLNRWTGTIYILWNDERAEVKASK